MRAIVPIRAWRRLLAPRWLLEGEGGAIGFALDVMKDALVDKVRLGLMARLPQNDPTGQTTAPADALVEMGRDRRIIRGRNESDASYAARLRTWLDEHKTAGNPFTLMRQLAAYTGEGCAFRTVDVRGNWYSRDASGVETSSLKTANWDWDGDTARWARFWVVIYPPASLWTSTIDDWGDVDLDWAEQQHTWGSTATPEEVEAVRGIVSAWMPGGTRCVSIIVAFDPSSFDPTAPEPDGLWGRWSKVVDGVRVASRLSTARYWDGVSV